LKNQKQPLLVAIVGGSGSGKSWLAERLKAALGKRAGRLSLDDFYRDRSHLSPARRERINFDHPGAIDWTGFKKVLNHCLDGQDLQLPGYDFQTHCRLRRLRRLKPKPIMLIDGLWLLRAPGIRKLFGFSIFLDVPMRKRFRQRLARDVAGRGRSWKSVREQFRKTVEPMHRKFVEDQIHRADLVHKGQWSDGEIAEVAALLRQKLSLP
jgi:uridine kinase